jgi:hypothetical protein
MANREDLERDGVRPDVLVAEAVHVVIHRPQAPMRAFRDDGTVRAFFDWMQENKIYPMKDGGGASGPGFYVGTFDAAHGKAIRKFFRKRGFDA